MTSPDGRRTRARRLALITSGIAAPLLIAGAAFAAVSPTPVSSTNGNAGYNATTSDPAGFTDTQAVVTGGQYGLAVKSGAHGVQLCRRAAPAPTPSATTATPSPSASSASPSATPTGMTTATPTPSASTPAPAPSGRQAPDGFAAQVGLLSDNLKTTYSVASAVGTLPQPGCPVGGVLANPVTFPNLSAVPYAHRVWLDANLVKRTHTVRVLVCVLRLRLGAPPTPPAPDQGPPNTFPHQGTFRGVVCTLKTFTRTASSVVFMAQDLDAPTTTPVAGDLPGVQTRAVRVPNGTVFNNAAGGVNEDLTSLVACQGNGYPKTLPGPAAYVSAACQPVDAFDHATATVGSGTPQGFTALDTTEGVSPGSTTATPALVAPDNTLAVTPASTPAGTATNASTGGSSWTMLTGNVPTS